MRITKLPPKTALAPWWTCRTQWFWVTQNKDHPKTVKVSLLDVKCVLTDHHYRFNTLLNWKLPIYNQDARWVIYCPIRYGGSGREMGIWVTSSNYHTIAPSLSYTSSQIVLSHAIQMTNFRKQIQFHSIFDKYKIAWDKMIKVCQEQDCCFYTDLLVWVIKKIKK